MRGQPSSAEGIHVGAIARAVGGDAVTIRYEVVLCYHPHLIPPFSNALDELTDDGVVYTAADDSHFMLAE